MFPVAILLAFLVLAALYECWTLPLAVILIVPMCMLSRAGRREALPAATTTPSCRSAWSY